MLAGVLEIQMLTNLAKLQSDMDSAKTSVTGAMGAITSAVELAKKAIVGLAAGMTVGIFADMIKGAIEAQAELKRLSDRTGATVESLSGLKGVAKLSGTSMDEVGAGLQKLSKAMVAAQAGSGAQADAFAKLGISGKELAANMNDPGQMMLLVAKHMDEFNDGAPKTALMMALMGKGGANLGTVMKDLAEKGELVGKVTTKQADEAEKFMRLLTQWNAKWKELFSTIATAILPIMNDFFGAMVKGGGITKTLTGYVKELAASGQLREWATIAKEALELLFSAIVPAIKVATAYFAIFVAAPAIFAAVAAAMMPVINALALYAMNVLIGQTATLSFTKVLFGVSVASELAAGSLTLLGVASNVLFAAFAGWQVGSWLSSQFVEARVAGLTFVGLMLTGWENLKYAGQMAWEGIKFVAEATLNALKTSFAIYLSTVASGLAAIGATDTSKQINAYAESMRLAATSQKTFAEQTAGVTAAHKDQLAVIDANIVDMVAWELANDGAGKAVGEHGEKIKKAKKDLGDLADGLSAANKAIQSFMEALQKEVDTLGMTTTQIAIYNAGKLGINGANLELVKSQRALIDAYNAEQTAIQELAKAIDASNQTAVKAYETVLKQAEAEELRGKKIGLTTEQLGFLAIAEIDVLIAQQQVAAMTPEIDDTRLKAIELQIAALKRLRDATEGNTAKQASVDAAAAAAAEWQKGWEETDKLGRKVFTEWGMQGTNMAKQIGDTLKKALLSAIYEATIKPIALQVYTSITGGPGGLTSSAAQMAGSGGGISNLISGGNSAYTALTGGGLGSTVSGLIGSGVSSMFGGVAGNAALGGALGLGAGSASAAAVAAAEAAGTAVSASAAGLATSAAGIASTFAAAIPYIGLAVLAISLLSKKGIASQSTGSMERTYDASGNITSSNSPFAAGNGGAVVDGLQQAFRTLQAGLGGTGGSSFGYGSYSGNDNKNPQFRMTGAGFNSGEIAQTDEAMKLAASRAVFAALQQSELPRELSGLFNGFDAASMTTDQINNVYAYGAALKAFDTNLQNMPFENIKNLSYDAMKGLIGFSGDLPKLTANLGTYYTEFYSAQEKAQKTAVDIAHHLQGAGATDVTAQSVAGMTREQFRAMVEAQDVTTTSGQKMFAALMDVAGAFAGLVPATTAAANGIAAVTTTISDTLKNLIKDRTNLEADLMQAQGNTGGADASRRTVAITGYSEAEIAAYDYNAALRAQITALNDATTAQQVAADKAKSIAAQRGQMDITVMELQGNAAGALAAKRAIELAAMDEALRPLQQTIYGFQDVASAAAATASAAATAAAAAQQAAAQQAAAAQKAEVIAQQRGQIEIAIMSLQGDAAGVLAAQRKAELAAMDASLRPLKQVQYGLQDVATAAAEAAVAAQKAAAIAQQRGQLDIQIMELQGNSAGALAAKRAIELAALDASLQPLQKTIYGLQDLATAAAITAAAEQKATAILAQRGQMEITLMELQGNSAGALAAKRAIELAAMDASLRPLQQTIYGLQDLATTAAKTATDLAAAKAAAQTVGNDALQILNNSINDAKAVSKSVFDAQIAIINAQKSSATEAFNAQKVAMAASMKAATTAQSAIASLSSALQSTLDSMQLAGSESMTRMQAQAQIQQDLQTVKATGVLPSSESLKNALSVVAKPSEQLFSTFVDYQRDFLLTKNNITALNDVAKTQLSAADQTVILLQSMMDNGQAQYDALMKQYDDAAKAAQLQYDTEIKQYDAMYKLAQDQLAQALGTKLAVLSVAAAIANLQSAISGIGKLNDPGPSYTGGSRDFNENTGLYVSAPNPISAPMVASQPSGMQDVTAAIEDLTAQVATLTDAQNINNGYAKTAASALSGNGNAPIVVQVINKSGVLA